MHQADRSYTSAGQRDFQPSDLAENQGEVNIIYMKNGSGLDPKHRVDPHSTSRLGLEPLKYHDKRTTSPEVRTQVYPDWGVCTWGGWGVVVVSFLLIYTKKI